MQRCGLCSIISSLLRRAMCVGSRRGSGESYYQELAETNIADVATMETTDSSSYKRLISTTSSNVPPVAAGTTHVTITTATPTGDMLMHDPDDDERRNSANSSSSNSINGARGASNLRRISENDRPLFESLLAEERGELPRRRHACTGRFLTMHKRRRKKLLTRSLTLDQAILDDVLHGQVQCILDRVNHWRFNSFTLETVTGGRSLPVLCVHLFHWYGLLEHFNLDVVRVWKLFSLIEEGYHSTNPYHNSIHATDVTQAMHCFLQEKRILENLSPLEIMASLIGAVTHDLDHPGVNQPFLIATSNHLAALYENTSVLENHHWRSAIGCLLESGVAEQVHDIRPELEKQISSLILATDITRQQEFIGRFRDYLSRDALDMRDTAHRHFILQISLKCADISNPCRPWDISKKWSMKVCEEFFRQGDYERQLNLPVTSLCDRQTTTVPKIQTGFIKFVVTPLMDEWHRFLRTDLSHSMMHNLKHNQAQWESKLQAEINEETRTEISDAELLDDEEIDENGGAGDDECDEVLQLADLSDSSEVLLPAMAMSKLGRRSSLQVAASNHGFGGRARNDRRLSVPATHCIPRIILPGKDSSAGSGRGGGGTSGGEYSLPHESIQESDEHRFDNDSLSIFSSDSDSLHRGARGSSTGSTADRERPLSAENLLPDCSIASMTDGACGDRLNLVLHGAASMGNTANLLSVGTSKHLIRQQTFPPLQPYVRTRYMSSQAELGACPEALLESNSCSSNSSSSSATRAHHSDTVAALGTGVESRGRILLAATRKDGGKREQQRDDTSGSSQADGANGGKIKVPKLSLGQKENLDPVMLKRNLSRRRGSAPVTVALPPKQSTASAGVTSGAAGDSGTGTVATAGTDSAIVGELGKSFVIKTCELMRRGSMPADVLFHTRDLPSSQGTTGGNGGNSSVHPVATLPNSLMGPPCSIQRRGSVPCESSNVALRSSFSIKRRSTKKAIRRRSSGGAEILSPILSEDAGADGGNGGGGGGGSSSSSAWYRIKRDAATGHRRSDNESLLSRRRGSLPVEVLAIGYSGTLRH
uniref:Phosphodiesterase n=1 Tax=Anopheles atroparvus TaxID=41427 RepID=A0AAG5DD10_ANOAO